MKKILLTLLLLTGITTQTQAQEPDWVTYIYNGVQNSCKDTQLEEPYPTFCDCYSIRATKVLVTSPKFMYTYIRYQKFGEEMLSKEENDFMDAYMHKATEEAFNHCFHL